MEAEGGAAPVLHGQARWTQAVATRGPTRHLYVESRMETYARRVRGQCAPRQRRNRTGYGTAAQARRKTGRDTNARRPARYVKSGTPRRALAIGTRFSPSFPLDPQRAPDPHASRSLPGIRRYERVPRPNRTRKSASERVLRPGDSVSTVVPIFGICSGSPEDTAPRERRIL
jgi:hypothetical protein